MASRSGNRRRVAFALASMIAAGSGSAALAAEEDAAAQFAILEFLVLGNQQLPARDIEQAVYPHLGPERGMQDIEAARVALQNLYQARGFGTVLVDIPEQRVEGGVVRLRVTEGRLDRVRITGARYFANDRIRAAVPALAPGVVPNLPDVQRELAVLNSQTPDRIVRPVLKAGAAPGFVDVELKVQDSLPLHGAVEVNDRYTADTTRLRANASLSYSNLFQRYDVLQLQYQTAPEAPSDMQVLVGSYTTTVLGSPTTKLTAYAVKSDTDVAALGTLSVLGKGKIFGARLTQVLPTDGDYPHSLTAGVDYKDFLEDIRIDSETGLVTPISYVNWSLTYTGRRPLGKNSSLSFNAGGNFGLRGVGNSSREFADKRARGKPNYLALSGDLDYTRRLPQGLELGISLAAQYAPMALVSSEQFALGGRDSIRGYYEASVLGDYGVGASVELRSDAPARWLNFAPAVLQAYAFVDGGVVAIHDALPEAGRSAAQVRSTGLGSIGLGVRLSGFHGAGANLDWARVLSHPAAVRQRADGLHFSIDYSF
jgi:hemolysin activation/secretion protein